MAGMAMHFEIDAIVSDDSDYHMQKKTEKSIC
jgi:hypothetical protein